MNSSRGGVPTVGGSATLGIALIVFSFLALATKGIVIKFLHADDVNVITMLFVRNLAAAPFFWMFAVLRLGGSQMLTSGPAQWPRQPGPASFATT